MEASRLPQGSVPGQSHFDQSGGVHPPGVICNCDRDFLTLTLEESCQPCPCTRSIRVWASRQGAGAVIDDEEDEE